MKKTYNKGFSLVELIIVIAIIAILAGVIAPVLIRYIDKSRKSNDITSAKTIKTAVESVMTSEPIALALTTGTTTTVTDLDGNTIETAAIIVISPSTVTSDNGSGVSITPASDANLDGNALDNAKIEIGNNIGEQTPKINYRKAADGSNIPTDYYVYISEAGSVTVGIGTSSAFYQLVPATSNYYQ